MTSEIQDTIRDVRRVMGIPDVQTPVHRNSVKAQADAKEGQEPAPRFNRPDAGNDELIAFQYADRLRWDISRQRWLHWNGQH
jgi:hypothetical protein